MIKTIMIRVNDKVEKYPVPEGVTEIKIEMDGGVMVNVEAPTKSGNSGKVYTRVEMNNLLTPDNPPDVFLTACDWDSEQGANKWRTDAMMYISYNGRIIGKNQTYGFASTEKPLATQPWTNPNLRKK